MIGIIIGLGDSLSAFCFIRAFLILWIEVWISSEGNIPVPAQFTSRKEENIMKGSIGSLTFMDSLQTTTLPCRIISRLSPSGVPSPGRMTATII
jgi:hypothetical protein